MVATAIVGSGLASAGASILGSSSAASAQEQASQEANATQQAMFNKEQSNLQPYISGGAGAYNQLLQRLPGLASPINPGGPIRPGGPITMNEATLKQTPGYQFNLTQGLKSVQNSAAARGLGISGAAMKGASNFATGLADSTYQNQFNNAMQNQQAQFNYGLANQQAQFNYANQNRANAYNFLTGASNTGESAATGLGAQGNMVASQMGQNTIGAGNAAAGSYMNMANSAGNAFNSIPQAYIYNNLFGMNNNNGVNGGSGGQGPSLP